MKLSALIVGLLLLSGCGRVMPDECAEGTDCSIESALAGPGSDLPDDASSGGLTDASPSSAIPVVIPAAMASASDDPTASETAHPPYSTTVPPMLNPSGIPLLTLLDADVLVSLLLDDLILDLFAPAPAPAPGPSPPDDDPTFLELLCRQGDTPDFICRQRYGY
jgi:hypothetical protein